MQEFIHLSKLLNSYNSLSNVYVSVTDLSGILSHPLLNIPALERIHAKKFCDIAKSTPKGFKNCRRCRFCADLKAINTKKLFHGHCVYGLYEIGLPIEVNGKVLGVIYVGNLVHDPKKSLKRAETTCKKTLVDYNALTDEFKSAQPATELEPYINIAETVASYIKLVLRNFPYDVAGNTHWVVREIKLYARNNFKNNISLTDLAKIFGFNEKYIGRLFKAQTDVSFTQYVNNLRLKLARKELLTTEKSVIDISLDCGFENVTYFNRLFKAKHGLTPSEYRRQRPIHS